MLDWTQTRQPFHLTVRLSVVVVVVVGEAVIMMMVMVVMVVVVVGWPSETRHESR